VFNFPGVIKGNREFFFRLNTLIAFFLIGSALLAMPFGSFNFNALLNLRAPEAIGQLTYLFLVLSSLFLLIYNLFLPRLHGVLLSAAIVAGMLGISFYALAAVVFFRTPGVSATFLVLHEITAALCLGSVLGAMITGHWYLVQHKLSITPLKKSTLLYLISVSLKTLLIGASFFLYGNWANGKILELLTTASLGSVFLYLRLIVGLVLPVIFGVMIWKAVKLHSTQSATGMLYATIVLILMGEMFGKVLTVSLGMPL